MIVNCRKKEMATCIYGCGEKTNPMCNYICITGVMRRCPATACEHYQKIDKKHPRLKSIDEEMAIRITT